VVHHRACSSRRRPGAAGSDDLVDALAARLIARRDLGPVDLLVGGDGAIGLILVVEPRQLGVERLPALRGPGGEVGKLGLPARVIVKRRESESLSSSWSRNPSSIAARDQGDAQVVSAKDGSKQRCRDLRLLEE